MVSKLNPAQRSVTVEWYERGETKGKEVELDMLLALNPELIQNKQSYVAPPPVTVPVNLQRVSKFESRGSEILRCPPGNETSKNCARPMDQCAIVREIRHDQSLPFSELVYAVAIGAIDMDYNLLIFHFSMNFTHWAQNHLVRKWILNVKEAFATVESGFCHCFQGTEVSWRIFEASMFSIFINFCNEEIKAKEVPNDDLQSHQICVFRD